MNKIDPILRFLHLVLRGFLTAKLDENAKGFINDNIAKHRRVLWLNVPATMLVYMSLRHTPPENIPTMIMALLAP